MTFQTLSEFQSTFASAPVEVELEQFAKDGKPFTVFLKPLTSKDRDNFEASVVGVDGKRDLSNLRARLVSRCLVDEKGKPIGTANQIGDLDAEFVGAVFNAVRTMNGMDTDDVAEAGKD